MLWDKHLCRLEYLATLTVRKKNREKQSKPKLNDVTAYTFSLKVYLDLSGR